MDILQECWRAKTLLERRTTGKQVRSVLLEPEAGLGFIGLRAASVADMMHSKTDEINRAIAAEFGDAEPALATERCLQKHAADRNKKLLAPAAAALLWGWGIFPRYRIPRRGRPSALFPRRACMCRVSSEGFLAWEG